MSIIHFLNVLEGDCNIIQHDIDNRVTVIDVSNAYNEYDTPEERAVRASQEREQMRTRTLVPQNKKDYRQKLFPDNPIQLRILVQRGHQFRMNVGSDSGASWAPIPGHRGQ
jgi:competence protein ComEC